MIGEKRGNKIEITHNGETLSLCEWNERLGLGPWTVHKRRRKGWPVEKVLSPIPLWAKPDSMRQRSRKSGISNSTVFRRVKNGMPLDEALTKPVRGRS